MSWHQGAGVEDSELPFPKGLKMHKTRNREAPSIPSKMPIFCLCSTDFSKGD